MPYYSDDSFDFEPDTLALDNGKMTRQSAAEAVATSTGNPYGLLDLVTKFAPLAVADTIDSVASSLTFGKLIERGSVNTGILNAIGSPGLNQFYQDNQEGLNTFSGILGSVATLAATDGAAAMLGARAGSLSQVATKLPWFRRVLALDEEYVAAQQTARLAELANAGRGTIGESTFLGRLHASTNLTQVGMMRGARNAAIGEAALALTMNQNEFVFDDSLATNMAWAALGIGLGVGIERAIAGKFLRQIASDDAVLTRHANAWDPSGGERSRLNMWTGIGRREDLQTPTAQLFDEITELQLEAQSLRSGESDELVRNVEPMATQLLRRAREKLAPAVSKGLPHDGNTRIKLGADTKDSDVTRALDYLLVKDPSATMGVRWMGQIPEGKTFEQVAQGFTDRIPERHMELVDALNNPNLTRKQREKITAQIRNLNKDQDSVIFGVIDGERVPLSEALAHENYKAPEPKNFFQEDKVFGLRLDGQKRVTATIDDSLILHTKGGKKLQDLDYYDVRRVFSLGKYSADKMIQMNKPIVLGENPSWFSLDLAEYILSKTDNPNLVKFPDGMTRESAQVKSFAQKAKELSELMKSRAGRNVDVAIDSDMIEARDRFLFNLPRLTSYEMGLMGNKDSVPFVMAKILGSHSPEQIEKMTLRELKEVAAKYSNIGDMANMGHGDVKSLVGNSFEFGLNHEGKPMATLIGVMEPLQPMQWNQEWLISRIAQNRAAVTAILSGVDNSEQTQLLFKILRDSPDTPVAFDVSTLRDTQLSGDPFAASTRIKNAFLTLEHIARDAPALRSAINLTDMLHRVNNGFITQTYQRELGDILGRLANPVNRESQLLVDSYMSFGRGWDKKAPIQQDGKWVFPLADTDANRAKFLSMTGREMEKGQLMVSPRGVTVALDDLGMDAVTRYNKLEDLRLQGMNDLRRAKGMPEIERKDFFVRSPKLNGKYYGLAFGPDNRQVTGFAVVADTEAEYAKKVAEVEKSLESRGFGYRVRSYSEVQEYGDIWDKAAFEFADASHATNASKQNKGLLIQQDVQHGAYHQALENLKSAFHQHSRDMVQVMFDDAIKGARSRAAIASEMKRVSSNPLRATPAPTIYDRWYEAVMGNTRINSQKSALGVLSSKVEGVIDNTLKAIAQSTGASPTLAKVTELTNAWFHRLNPWSDSDAAVKDFKALSTSLGKYMPIQDHAQWLETKGYGASPFTSRELSQNFSSFTSTLLLRFGESAHAIMTAGGLVAAMPAVTRQLSRRVGESLADWQSRTSQFGLTFVTPGGKDVGVIDMTKIAAAGVKALWDPSFAPILDDMARRGMTSQEVAEFNKQMAVMTSRGSWAKGWLGDPTISNPKTLWEKMKSKGLIGSMSVLTDSAENYSRALASTTGYKLAENIGIHSHEGKMRFAHNYANQVIANYNPANKAEIFQGPFGSAIGLFKSFMQNYYQRLYGYVENADWKSLANQFVAQGALFGIPSVPGWGVLDAVSSWLNDGESNATDRMQINNKAATDLLMGGAISNLPKLFGQEAMAIYSRGDVNIRIPSASEGLGGLIPAVTVTSKLLAGLGEMADVLRPGGVELSSQQIGEVLSNYLVNRPLAGLMEVSLAGGYDTDFRGATVARSTTMADSIYRILGTRNMAHEEQIRAFYRSKPAQEHQAALKDKLRRDIRAAVRSGNVDEVIDSFKHKYMDIGGDPKYFSRFYNDAVKKAKVTRSELALEKAMRKADNAEEITRYLEAGTPIYNEDQDRVRELDVLRSLSSGSFTQEVEADENDPFGLDDPTTLIQTIED